jgi:hypothetical protein
MYWNFVAIDGVIKNQLHTQVNALRIAGALYNESWIKSAIPD